MYDLVIIGAGAVGLSIARYFQVERRWQCLVVEKEDAIGQGISSRNSEVIHAGLYYPIDSLKAGLCVEGKERLYHYLQRDELPHRRCGKYVVSTPDREAALVQLQEQGRRNGVDDLEMISECELQGLYPALATCPALYSPSTGILSVDQWMGHLAGAFQAAGGDLALNTAFTGMTPSGDGYELTMTDASGETVDIPAERAINAAGLDALEVADQAGFNYRSRGYRLRYCKGSYFKVPGARGLFRHLIYPLPAPNSLGIHIRLDLLDEVHLGPDAEYLPENVPDYNVDPHTEGEFRRHVREYWPGVDDYPLEPDWAGVRPHLYVEDAYHPDFCIETEAASGCPGWVNLLGIDSPGLTAAMAVGPHIAGLWNDGDA